MYQLEVARKRLHIVEGLRIALNHLDEVVKIIRSAEDDREAREGLMSNFGLSEEQANAILDMRLRRLTSLEREKLEDEFLDLLENIRDLEDILARPERVVAIIKEELIKVKEKYGDARRTKVEQFEASEDIEDLIQEESIVINLTNRGYIKRQPLNTYRSQKRGGRGLLAPPPNWKISLPRYSSPATWRRYFSTNKGKVYSSKAYNIPEASRHSKEPRP